MNPFRLNPKQEAALKYNLIIKRKFSRLLVIGDISKIRDGQRLGFIYKNGLKSKLYNWEVRPCFIHKDVDIWTVDGYRNSIWAGDPKIPDNTQIIFNMNSPTILENLNNLNFELKDIEYNNSYWSLFYLK